MGKEYLKRHRLVFCHGKRLTKDEIDEESDLLTNIIMKEIEENYFVKNKTEDNSKMESFDDKMEELRSSITRFIQLTLKMHEYNPALRVECPDCGIMLLKSSIKRHQDFFCLKRKREN